MHFVSCTWSYRYVNHVKTNVRWLKYHQMGRQSRLYPHTLKLTFAPTIYIQGIKHGVTHYPCCPILPWKHTEKDFSHRIYFWFSYYRACASFKHKLMYLYVQSEMEKWGASLFLKWQYPPPPWPRKSFILQTYDIYLHNICKQEAGSSGAAIFSKPKKICGQNPVWKNILKQHWK